MSSSPDRDVDSPAARHLHDRLRMLHREAGEPSTREIARRIGSGVLSHTSVHAVLRRPATAKWANIELVVEALQGDPAEFHPLWLGTRDTLATGPEEPNKPVRDYSPFEQLFDDSAVEHLTAADKQYFVGDYAAARRSLALLTAAVRHAEGRPEERVGRYAEAEARLREALESLAAVGEENAEGSRPAGGGRPVAATSW